MAHFSNSYTKNDWDKYENTNTCKTTTLNTILSNIVKYKYIKSMFYHTDFVYSVIGCHPGSVGVCHCQELVWCAEQSSSWGSSGWTCSARCVPGWWWSSFQHRLKPRSGPAVLPCLLIQCVNVLPWIEENRSNVVYIDLEECTNASSATSASLTTPVSGLLGYKTWCKWPCFELNVSSMEACCGFFSVVLLRLTNWVTALVLDVAATLFAPETPKVFCGFKHFTHSFIGIGMGR